MDGLDSALMALCGVAVGVVGLLVVTTVCAILRARGGYTRFRGTCLVGGGLSILLAVFSGNAAFPLTGGTFGVEELCLAVMCTGGLVGIGGLVSGAYAPRATDR